MKKTSTLIAVLVLLFCGISRMQASVISPSQAKEVAAQFMAEKTARKELKTDVVFDAVDRNNRPYLYAVHTTQEGGYVIVSGDDRFAKVLAYSDSRLYDEQDMPDNMRAWLQGYIDEMRYLESIDYQPTLRSTSSEKPAIAPLIETIWGQNTPFNDSCPVDINGSRSITGCVATAMAQLINYHIQHYGAPTATIAEIEGYTTAWHQLTVDTIPAGTPLPDKSLLVNNYRSDAPVAPTEEQKKAVAQLMLYCGTSVKMDYASGSSAAYSEDVPEALITKFGFDNSTHAIRRTDYSYAEWMDVIYSELAVSRPVYHNGSSSGGGHAFIVDGYDGKGLFHVNWGWNGKSNDYFALSVLNPDDEGQAGASSSSDGYNISQRAIIGTRINSGETWERPIYLNTGNLRTEGQDVLFSAYNRTGETHSFDYGIGMVDETGTITLVGKYLYREDLKTGTGWANVRRPVPTDATYAGTTQKIVPISRERGTEKWYTSMSTDFAYFTAEYDSEGVPTLTAHPTTHLTAGDIYINSSTFVGEVQYVKTLLTNDGDEFYGTLYLFASPDETKGDYVSRIGVTALEGTTQEISIDWTPKETGTYNLWIAQDKDGEEVLCSSSVTIIEDPALIGKILAITGFSLDGLDAKSMQVDTETGIRTFDIYSDHFDGQVKITNLSSETVTYSFRILFDRYDEATGTFINDTYTGTYKNREFTAGQRRTFNIVDRKAEVNNTYRMRLHRVDSNPEEDLDTHFLFRMRTKDVQKNENVQRDNVQGTKILRNGKLYLMYDGKMYDVQGRLIDDL